MSQPRCSKCEREATREVFFLGRWARFCRYHVGAYYDLPQRSIRRIGS